MFVRIFQWIPNYCYAGVHWVCHSQTVLHSHSESILGVFQFVLCSGSHCCISFVCRFVKHMIIKFYRCFLLFFRSSSSFVSGVSCVRVWCFYPLRANVCTCVLVCSFVCLFVCPTLPLYIYCTCISVLFILFRSRSQKHKIWKTLSRSRARYSNNGSQRTKLWKMLNGKCHTTFGRMFNTEHSKQAGRLAGRRTKSILLTTECLSVHTAYTHMLCSFSLSLFRLSFIQFIHSTMFAFHYVLSALSALFHSRSVFVCISWLWVCTYTHTHICMHARTQQQQQQ